MNVVRNPSLTRGTLVGNDLSLIDACECILTASSGSVKAKEIAFA